MWAEVYFMIHWKLLLKCKHFDALYCMNDALFESKKLLIHTASHACKFIFVFPSADYLANKTFVAQFIDYQCISVIDNVWCKWKCNSLISYVDDKCSVCSLVHFTTHIGNILPSTSSIDAGILVHNWYRAPIMNYSMKTRFFTNQIM